MAREDLHHLKTEVTLEVQVQLSAGRHVTQGLGLLSVGSKWGIMHSRPKGSKQTAGHLWCSRQGLQHIQSEGLAAEQGSKGLGMTFQAPFCVLVRGAWSG